MKSTASNQRAYESETVDGCLLVRLRNEAFQILTDPLRFDDFFSLVEGLTDAPDVHGYLQLNDIDYEGRSAIEALVAQISQDEEALVRTGRYVVHQPELIAARFKHSFGRYLLAMTGATKPAVAAMRGNMSGEHLGFSLAFDVRVVTSDSMFSFDNVRTGLPASPTLTLLLPRYIGVGRTLSLLQTGAKIEAEEALNLGLVTRLVEDPEQLRAEALSSVRTLQHTHRHVVAYQRTKVLPSRSEMESALSDWYSAVSRAVQHLRQQG